MSRVFNGSTQYLQDTSPVSNPPATYACWVNADSFNAGGGSLVTSSVDGSSHVYMGLWVGSAGNISAQYRTTSAYVGAWSTAAVSTGVWSHAAAVLAASNDQRAYLDGANKGTNASGSGNPGCDIVTVGCRKTNTTYNFQDGTILWPAIWNVALTDDEIVSLAAGAYPASIRPESLVFFTPLGGFDGDNDVDVISGSTLTAYNSPTWSDDGPGELSYPSQTLLTLGSGGGGGGGGGMSAANRMNVNCGSSVLWGTI